MRWLIAAVLSCCLPQPAFVAELDHDFARDQLEAGEIVPLTEIISQVETEFFGQIIDVSLEASDDLEGGLLYRIELLTPQANIIELMFDSRTGELFGIGGQGIEPARREP